MKTIIVEGDTLSELASNANDSCLNNPVSNLLLQGEYPISELDSDFIKTFAPLAAKWQLSDTPKELHFTHGQYINRGKMPGREFIATELRKKPDSNRACLSLISMNDIVGSNDDPIPSFLILQFSFVGGDFKKIQVSAYFRALEVSKFLPINLAEICDILKFLTNKFPNMECFILTVFAFRAYAKPSFRCLEKAELDMATPIQISIAVAERDIPTLIKWVDSKIHSLNDSIVCTQGLQNLHEAIGGCSKKYPPGLQNHLKNAIDNSEEIIKIRKASSFAGKIDILQNKMSVFLSSARTLLQAELPK